jgi:transcriptional regulator with XRE-family HTH domain
VVKKRVFEDLDEEKIAEIKELRSEGLSYRDIAKRVKVDISSISRVLKGSKPGVEKISYEFEKAPSGKFLKMDDLSNKILLNSEGVLLKNMLKMKQVDEDTINRILWFFCRDETYLINADNLLILLEGFDIGPYQAKQITNNFFAVIKGKMKVF